MYVSCLLEVEDITASSMKMYVGVKAMKDTKLPMGTKVFIDVSSLPIASKEQGNQQKFEVVSTRVTEYAEEEGGVVGHLCSPLDRQFREEDRTEPRKKCTFTMKVGNLDLKIINGCNQGLGAVIQSDKMLASLALDKEYPLQTVYNGKQYAFKAVVKHIEYNWQTLIHYIGFALQPLDTEEETVINKLIDPNYTVKLKKAAVDAASGKISS